MIKKAVFILMAVVLIFGTSCSRYQQLLKSNDNEKKYKKALIYYEEGDYNRALQLFDQVIPIYKGTEKAEKIQYRYAYAYYKQEDYILASYYFKKFTKNFPNSDKAEECAYLGAYCKYLDSPKYSLDQTNTFEAIDELQLFINRYPQSERVDKCNELMDELRHKLERKYFEIARLYLKMSDYKASIFTFDNVIKDYPGTDYREEILFLKVRANYEFAERSIEEKKEERYINTIEAFESLEQAYPDSEHLNKAKDMQATAHKYLKQIQ